MVRMEASPEPLKTTQHTRRNASAKPTSTTATTVAPKASSLPRPHWSTAGKKYRVIQSLPPPSGWTPERFPRPPASLLVTTPRARSSLRLWRSPRKPAARDRAVGRRGGCSPERFPSVTANSGHSSTCYETGQFHFLDNINNIRAPLEATSALPLPKRPGKP